MGVPRIKFYQLPPGYSEAGDNDVQQIGGDELLPIVDKSDLLTDALFLTGIMPVTNETLTPINFAGGRNSYILGPNGSGLQTPTGIAMTDILRGPVGELEMRVLTAASAIIPPTGYIASDSGIQFLIPPPSGATISCYSRAALPANDWALGHDQVYDGDNSSFNKVVISVDDGVEQIAVPLGTTRSYIHLAVAGSSGVKAESYWYENTTSQYFCGEHENWVGGHYRMWPDIFIGTKDYPGDATEVNGTPFDPGQVPEYQEVGTYQLNYRQGLVTFPSAVDSEADPVRANYAYLKGIGNVTNQKLDQVAGTSGKEYKTGTEGIFPESHGKRLVNRNDEYMPFNVYVDGVLTPTPRIVAPYDTLTILT